MPRGRKSLKESERLVQVAGAVPLLLHDYIVRQAKAEQRTQSQIVRRMLENSLEYKAQTNPNQKGKKR